MKAIKLSEKYTTEELCKMMQDITNDPDNLNPDKTSIWIYTKSARKKMDEISWAITYKRNSKLTA